MKKVFYTALGLFIIGLNLFSQDVVRRINGDSILCKITKVDSTKVYFDFVRNSKQFSSFLNKKDIASFEYDVLSKKSEANIRTSKNNLFILTADPIGFITFGPSISGELLMLDKEKSSGVGLFAGFRLTNLGIASYTLLGAGDMNTSFVYQFAFRYYPKIRNVSDGFFLGPHIEFGTSNFTDGDKTKIRAFGGEIGYKWVHKSGFDIELVDCVGLIQSKNEPAVAYYEFGEHEPEWKNLAFVFYMLSVRMGIVF